MTTHYIHLKKSQHKSNPKTGDADPLPGQIEAPPGHTPGAVDLKKTRDYIRLIERRIMRLEHILDDYGGVSDSYARHELAALRWALPILCEQTGIPQVYVSNGVAS